ncbi:MAG: Fructose-bisphosphate aldolase, partial [Clostridiales bacterium 38_11]
VAIAHVMGASVEGELGRIGGTEEHISVSAREATMTDPEEARCFAAATGVDALAIAIGTAHGRYKGTPELDFDRLAAIDHLVPTPIVLHGSSGVPDAAIRRAVELGVRKINIDTDGRLVWTRVHREYFLEHPEGFDLRGPGKIFMSEYAKFIAAKNEKLGSAGELEKVRAFLAG